MNAVGFGWFFANLLVALGLIRVIQIGAHNVNYAPVKAVGAGLGSLV